MKKGDVVYIDYVGRIKDTNEIFDLTIEEIAKKEGIYNPNYTYKPIPIVVGFGFVIKGLDEEIEKMNEGEEKIVEVPPEKAFGKRDENLVKTFNLSDFKKQDVELKVGEFVNINGILGKVLSISGGRVVIDFNHPLAGKTLVYNIKIVKKVENELDKVRAVLEFFVKKVENFEVKEDLDSDAIIIVDKEKNLAPEQKKTLFNIISKIINRKRVIFMDIFEK
ncbi:MAG: peptidylprolyl isomerase [Candidatus Aenigmarchaeota archaeon]|nr:peptidylprolyl isomerase [Candidatus Aenigmarchaeota archaeon]